MGLDMNLMHPSSPVVALTVEALRELKQRSTDLFGILGDKGEAYVDSRFLRTVVCAAELALDHVNDAKERAAGEGPLAEAHSTMINQMENHREAVFERDRLQQELDQTKQLLQKAYDERNDLEVELSSQVSSLTAELKTVTAQYEETLNLANKVKESESKLSEFAVMVLKNVLTEAEYDDRFGFFGVGDTVELSNSDIDDVNLRTFGIGCKLTAGKQLSVKPTQGTSFAGQLEAVVLDQADKTLSKTAEELYIAIHGTANGQHMATESKTYVYNAMKQAIAEIAKLRNQLHSDKALHDHLARAYEQLTTQLESTAHATLEGWYTNDELMDNTTGAVLPELVIKEIESKFLSIQSQLKSFEGISKTNGTELKKIREQLVEERKASSKLRIDRNKAWRSKGDLESAVRKTQKLINCLAYKLNIPHANGPIMDAQDFSEYANHVLSTVNTVLR